MEFFSTCVFWLLPNWITVYILTGPFVERYTRVPSKPSACTSVHFQLLKLTEMFLAEIE